MQEFVKSTVDGIDGIVPVPIGTIVSYLPGYFGTNANGSYVAVSLVLPDGWKICDGSLCLDSASLIFSSTGRYLPKLTDSRFIMGSTVIGSGITGGNTNNTYTILDANLPIHAHTMPHTHTFYSGALSTSGNLSHSHQRLVYWVASGGFVPGAVYAGYQLPDYPSGGAIPSMVHYHALTSPINSTYSGNSGDGDAAVLKSDPFSILPKYLLATYIMRIK